jgi:O-antigen/teichoic acid export membrane protein
VGQQFGTVARNSALSMVGLVVLGGTRVVYGAMVSHVTNRQTYGLVGALLAVTLISSFVLPVGIASAVSRFVPFTRARSQRHP